ncbi:IscS subfamily cysteine desulfurase [Myxococcota bacterium]|nr:IscS subfamily cysteine desulfurase [Myxococcota bacterium]MBU1429168.1 IscS subfamily cysteine desulfurase [Myxococcota bacterium]
MKLPIYMDNHATTACDPRVVEAMLPYLTEHFGNAASRNHSFGWTAEQAVDKARAQIAALIGASAREIVFTSGATESDNAALKGVAEFYASRGKHIITQATEHKAVIDSARALERQGYEITWLPLDTEGLVKPEDVAAAIRPDTILVSVMHGNNEIGTVQPIAEIGAVCKARKVLFHTDAVQTAGKLPIDVEAMGVDLLSLSAHKMYGPKGIGALYVRRKQPRVRVAPLIHGGGHERGMRSGTLPVHQIVGFGAAAALAMEEMEAETARLIGLRERLRERLVAEIPECHLNGSLECRLPGNLNMSFAFVEGESLLMDLKDVAVSSGSACTSASLEPSYVLRALGVEDELAHSSIRFGIGRFNTQEEIDFVAERVIKAVSRLRALSPLWEMHQEGIDLKSVQWTAH